MFEIKRRQERENIVILCLCTQLPNWMLDKRSIFMVVVIILHDFIHEIEMNVYGLLLLL